MITRWDKWFADDNLAKDKRILSAPPTQSVRNAAQIFSERKINFVLDLACGIGRDTYHLSSCGLDVVGADASYNGVQTASKIKPKQSSALKWVTADARHLPFPAGSFEGIYCFGLLHEFTGDDKEQAVKSVMDEIKRLLCEKGLLVLTILSGEPTAGLPHVQLFSRQMFDDATQGMQAIEVKEYDDIGCTGRPDYRIWYGAFHK